MQRKYDDISEEVKKKCIDEVIARVEDIEVSSVGVIAAQDIIDIVLEHYGPRIYNAALNDSKKLLESKFADIEFEINQLEQSY